MVSKWGKKKPRTVKNYIKDTLKIDIGENDYNAIHRVGPKITNSNGQALQQVIVMFKGFSPRSLVYKARKRKSNIFVHLDLTKRHYLLFKDTYNKVKDDDRIAFICFGINCSLCLRLKNDKWEFFFTPQKSFSSCFWIWSDFSINIGGVFRFRAQSNISDGVFCYFCKGLYSGILIEF